MGELKPCPFCGAKAFNNRMGPSGYQFKCDNGRKAGGCGAEGPFMPTEQEAIEAWNRRPSSDLLVEALERIAGHCDVTN